MKKITKKGSTFIESHELPRVSFSRSRTLNDFEIEKETLEATGYTVEEARENFSWLMKESLRRG